MRILYSLTQYEEASVDIDGIVKDLQYRGMFQEEDIKNDILDNYEYYLENYSDMPFDGNPDDDSLDELVTVVIDKLNEL